MNTQFAEPTRPARGVRRRARTRAALVSAARRLFAERGVDGPTIQEITEAADVAKGSFYNHFDSREALQRAVAASAFEALGAALDRDVAQRESDPARVVAASLLCTLRACIEDRALGGFLLKNVDVLDAGRAIGDRGRRDLERGRASGRFAYDDLDLVMAAIAGAGQAVLRGRLGGALAADAEIGLVALALRMLGLAPDAAGALAADAARELGGKA